MQFEAPVQERGGAFEAVPSRRVPSDPTAIARENGEEIFLHSAFDPRAEAERTLDAHGVKEGTRVWLFGMGLGYLAEAALSRVGPSGRLTVFEPNQSLHQFALKTRDLSRILNDGRTAALTGGPPKALDQFARILEEMAREDGEANTAIIFHAPSIRTLPPEADEIRDCLEDLQVRIQNFHRYAGLIQDNISKNRGLRAGDPDVSAIFGKAKGLPAFVVSAGPSLDKNIRLLAKEQDQGAVIAVDAALAPLLKQGIEPHVVVTLEANQVAEKFFRGIHAPRSILAYSWSSWPGVPALHEGPRCAYPNAPASPEDRDKTLAAGGSVSITALDLAFKMGCSPIVLLGLDLCFPTEWSHCEHCAVRRPVVPFEGEKDVRTTDGGAVKTPGNFYLYVKRTGRLCGKISREVPVYNATEGPTVLPNTETATLKSVLDALPAALARGLRDDLNRALSSRPGDGAQ